MSPKTLAVRRSGIEAAAAGMDDEEAAADDRAGLGGRVGGEDQRGTETRAKGLRVRSFNGMMGTRSGEVRTVSLFFLLSRQAVGNLSPFVFVKDERI
jgi:hypothetical protein